MNTTPQNSQLAQAGTDGPNRRRLSNFLGMAPAARPENSPVPWRGVFFEGPEPDRDAEGEEIPVWHVFIGDEEAEPIGKVYNCYSFKMGETLAKRMAKDRHLELIQEAMPA